MRVLLIVHGYPPQATGGTEIYTRDLAVALAAMSDVSVFVLARDSDPRRPDGDVRHELRGPVHIAWINNTFASCRSFEDTYRHPVVCRAAEAVIRDVRPDVAHVHHLTCLSTDLVSRLKALSVPVVLTLHDYWLLCHRGQLVDRDYVCCEGPVTGACARCVPPEVTLRASAYRAAGLAREVPGLRLVMTAVGRVVGRRPTASTDATGVRLRYMREVARQCDLILAPSATVRDRFVACGMPMERVERWTLGVGLGAAARAPRRSGAPLRLGFVGSFLPTKAPHLLIEAAVRLPAGTVSVDLAGAGSDYHGDRSYEARLAPWLGHSVVRQHAAVTHEDMPAWLARVDVLVLPSVWLENSPLVIKEAFAAGVPVVASDLGGMAELVRHDVDGLTFPAGSVAGLEACLRRLIDEPALVDRLRAAIDLPDSIGTDAARTLQRYRRVAASRLRAPAVSRASLAQGAPSQITAVILNYRAPQQTGLAVQSLLSSCSPPSSIVVVDNSAEASPGALAELLSDHQCVSVVEAPRNLGFAGGCNLGIDQALLSDTRFILFINSDAVLAPDALSLLLQTAADHPAAGILTPLIVMRGEPGIVESAGVSFQPRSGRMRLRLAGESAADSPPAAFDVDAVTGCVMLIRREVFDRVGRFDEAYFYSFEDLDLCLRARDAGFQIMCVPAARAHHEGGHSIGRRSSRRVYFATRNHLRLMARRQPRRARRGLAAASVVALNTAYVLTSPDAPLWSGLAAVVRGSWHHLLGRYGPDPAA